MRNFIIVQLIALIALVFIFGLLIEYKYNWIQKEPVNKTAVEIGNIHPHLDVLLSHGIYDLGYTSDTTECVVYTKNEVIFSNEELKALKSLSDLKFDILIYTGDFAIPIK